ncbi:glycosylphosphatidylinositol anchor attachment 1 protein [Thrips palmi]|uniref:GPI-anchor transamidase component GPAA1 n=1 Tax=Thrips palmi TaxID=161013 RepID=A0A6P8ZK53_THRPL|nr:glycosylphosphatidylinositol anchor attachment 1 protein [Thrips palmi]XP_034236504.1 glycosylphosphatidylinositol anchor attachment 1 protein [Thrips palmi]
MPVLLDPPEGCRRPTYLMVKHHRKLEMLMYLLGLVWFFALPSDNVSSASYFSENSLLPGLVKGGFVEDSFAKTLLASLQDEISANPTKMPYPWLLAQFRQIGLDTYTHNFTLNYPLASDLAFEGQNVYGILRAPRGSSTEAIVLSVPFRGSKSVHPSTAAGVALMLAIAKFCRRQKYWAKDLIFLITDHEQLGAQAWLEAYHQTSSGSHAVLNSGDLLSRGGAIQAAVNLELLSDRISHIDVKIEGLNGQLPNLDLVNLVHMLCNKEGVHHTFHNRANYGDGQYKVDPYKSWAYSLQTMLEMVFAQASGVPNGNHGLFHRFGIEAVTLTGYRKVDRGSPATFYQVGRVLEGILRSLNNLLERFHQSYFFYLLSATDRYISIGIYIPAVGLMASTLLLRALAVWRSLQLPSLQSDKAKLLRAQEISNSFASVGLTVLAAHALGVLLLRVPVWSALYLNVGADSSFAVVIGLLSFTAVTICLPSLMSMRQDSLLLLYVIGLIELATVLLAVSLHNFPLAILCSIVYVPFALFANGGRLRILRIVCWLLLQPLLLVAIMIFTYTSIYFPDDVILSKAVHAFKEALTFSYVDYAVYGNWMLSVGATFLFPTWFVLWVVVLKTL